MGDGLCRGARDDDVDGRLQLLGVLYTAGRQCVCVGVCGCVYGRGVWQRTLASSLTPCRLTPCRQRDWCSSFMVMGLDGSRRPWSIHDWMRSRFTGDISTLKLATRQHSAWCRLHRPRPAGTYGLYLPLPLSGLVISSGVCPPSKPAGTFPCACWPF
jgi:hypothetical protein